MQPTITHRAAQRMLRYKVAGGVLDFIGIAGCTFLILVLLVLLVNLATWLKGDLAQVFSGYFKNVTDAVVMPH